MPFGIGVNTGKTREIPVDSITANPCQPRRDFSETELQELKSSIEKYGILQPLIVRESRSGFELIAGERRLRAAKLAGLKTVPAIVRRVEDDEMASLALVENLQREDLNIMEEVEGYEMMINRFGYTQQTVAEMVGKKQSTIANKLRLLKLSEEIREALRAGLISERHGRALLRLEEKEAQLKAFRRVLVEGMSVRDLEAWIERILAGSKEEEAGRGRGRKVVRVYKDLRIFLNSFRQVVGALQGVGVDARMEERDLGEYLEVIVRVPKNRPE